MIVCFILKLRVFLQQIDIINVMNLCSSYQKINLKPIIFLKIEKNIIKKVNFLTDGCGASVAAGCQATLLIENQSVDEAEKLEAEDIDNALNGLPEDHKHCAELAATTLRRAIDDYHLSIKLKKSED